MIADRPRVSLSTPTDKDREISRPRIRARAARARALVKGGGQGQVVRVLFRRIRFTAGAGLPGRARFMVVRDDVHLKRPASRDTATLNFRYAHASRARAWPGAKERRRPYRFPEVVCWLSAHTRMAETLRVIGHFFADLLPRSNIYDLSDSRRHVRLRSRRVKGRI